MKTQDKKMDMACKMCGTGKGNSPVYNQKSKGGEGKSPKYAMVGKNSKFDKSGMMNYDQASYDGEGKASNFAQANAKGSFTGKYDM